MLSPFEARIEARFWTATVARARGEWRHIEAFLALRDDEGFFKDRTPVDSLPLGDGGDAFLQRASAVVGALASVDSGGQIGVLHDALHESLLRALGAVRPGMGDIRGLGVGIMPFPTFAAAAFDLGDATLMRDLEDGAAEVMTWEPRLPRHIVQAQLTLGFAAVMKRDREIAADLCNALLPWDELFDVFGGFSYARLLGLLSWTAGDVAGAETHFNAAIARCQATGFRTEIPRVYRDHAQMLVDERRDHGSALELIDAGEQAAADLGMVPIQQRLQALRDRLEASRRPGPGRPDGLTAREIEVLRLIAAGKSNQQIADALVITHSTAAKHAAHIFAKIGAANRAEATAYAIRNGLT